MKHLISSRVFYSILFYLLVLCVIVQIRPKQFFYDKKEVIQFGVGKNKTIFPLGLVVVLLSIISFYIFTIIDVFMRK